ncbi:MAG: phosphoribosylglycinamide formyltransferase [Prevotellaceae bacterium]|jgi:phosphoribosylglycinamide formyltransferase-1|nr:phosphoribosylglycinamide formyltransferase [Prevotellaceae bacterium]
MKNIAIFASGSGTNAENLIRHFNGKEQARACVKALFSNKPEAYALTRAAKLGVPAQVFGRSDLYSSNLILDELRRQSIDLIVLAGFLWLMPESIVSAFRRRIVNIHPALLPKYGGKGMYGMNVHRAVKAAGERETGITIHYVNAEYDRGDAIFQATCPVLASDTADDIAAKIHLLEQEHFPKIVEKIAAEIGCGAQEK